MQLLEQNDIQGLIARGYGKLPEATFLLLQITDVRAAKDYLKSIIGDVNTISTSPDDFAMQIAFTSKGIKQIGIPESAYSTFSREFLEGISEPFRALILGDQNEDDPKNWTWGGPKNDDVHLMMMCYAKDSAILESRITDKTTDLNSKGFRVIKTQETSSKIKESKEHFGFRDGISNPSLDGFRNETAPPENIRAGDFVLGYANEYNVITQRPVVSAADDPRNILPLCQDADNAGCKDLGKNGSYIVYRQMPQHVYRFWKYLYDNSQEPETDKIDAAIKLGTKMVGRWPGGAPLATSPNADDSAKAEETKFNYFNEDNDGTKCPFGSHVRRANPRDQLLNRSQDASNQMIRKHRIIRRGRSYGPCLVDSMEPADILEKGDDGQDRGLHFICLVSDLSRQFEFVQNAWIKSPTFAGLYNDADPIIAARQAPGNLMLNDQFTCPANPIRRKYTDIPQFTNVVGGGYFFLPGIKALTYIADC